MEQEETSFAGVNTEADQDNILGIGNNRELSPPWPPTDDNEDKAAEPYVRDEKEECWEYPIMAEHPTDRSYQFPISAAVYPNDGTRSKPDYVREPYRYPDHVDPVSGKWKNYTRQTLEKKRKKEVEELARIKASQSASSKDYTGAGRPPKKSRNRKPMAQRQRDFPGTEKDETEFQLIGASLQELTEKPRSQAASTIRQHFEPSNAANYLSSERFNIQDYIPHNTRKGRARPRYKDTVYEEFFQLSKQQTALMEKARLEGKKTWRFDGAEKIIEYFFDIDLSKLLSTAKGTDMEEALANAESYTEIPPDKSYIALDKEGKPLIVLYHDAYKRTWGSTMGEEIVETSTQNINKLIQFVPPKKPKDTRRHGLFDKWRMEEENQAFEWASGPSGRSGIYYFGLWKEVGHQHSPCVLTKDMTQHGQYASTMIRDLQLWASNISQTIDVCFAGIDKVMRDQYRQKFAGIRQEGNREVISARPEEIFHFQALLVNLLTEPHQDHKDWQGGWTWLTPFGSYEDGLFCLTLLERKLHFQPGAVIGIRGDKMEHFTTKWRGKSRFSWVFAFHQDVRAFG
ncbi:hypothetical protein FN846DRAFT_1007100 [Sphaerosporella brunnea]|uniref:Uncharacterized protein n=1 Tax=Sphaerosporella brunnea TaxID=1250544 RepID=A0A5J5F398_9PEZI|nr:hypothetical protein FN846DRAFT_1007100 [Sphaerosporella brunnea]